MAIQQLDSVTIRFAGDSGDGMQLTGSRFTLETAMAGNDLATLPNFPAEIRAPAGSLAGVSSFQIHFGSHIVNTPGEELGALVAMNPAALKTCLQDLNKGGILIVNDDAFSEKNLAKAGYTENPLDTEKLNSDYRLYRVPISTLTKEALSATTLSPREVERCKNFFALGLVLWMFSRPKASTLKWIERKFAKNPDLVEANRVALEAGLTYAEATEILDVAFSIAPAQLEPGTYRNLTGSQALALGLIAAQQKSGLQMFFGAYPITPASEILHELARYKHLGVTSFQAEDEIAAICAALGAAYSGALAVTSSSGPGISLKTEALALAVMTELPLVVVNVQRVGPSTGMPTKNEQADLMQAMFGRAGEAPIPILAASDPISAFNMAYEACRIATKYMTPVFLLSDTYVANCAEPWKIVDPKTLAKIEVKFEQPEFNGAGPFKPYLRDEKTLARPWALPGTPGKTHRIGGLEKENITGSVCYDGDNHQLMTNLRAEKVQRIAEELPPLAIDGANSGDLLILGWGGTEGTIREAVRLLRAENLNVSRVHLHYINPFQKELAVMLKNFKTVLIPEVNSGQLIKLIRDTYLIDAIGFNEVRGQPLRVNELVRTAKEILQPH